MLGSFFLSTHTHTHFLRVFEGGRHIPLAALPSGHSNSLHNTFTRASVFVNDIHARLITFVNPEISCIRMKSGRYIRISEGILYQYDHIFVFLLSRLQAL